MTAKLVRIITFFAEVIFFQNPPLLIEAYFKPLKKPLVVYPF